jgi:hypothetical protein
VASREPTLPELIDVLSAVRDGEFEKVEALLKETSPIFVVCGLAGLVDAAVAAIVQASDGELTVRRCLWPIQDGSGDTGRMRARLKARGEGVPPVAETRRGPLGSVSRAPAGSTKCAEGGLSGG